MRAVSRTVASLTVLLSLTACGNATPSAEPTTSSSESPGGQTPDGHQTTLEQPAIWPAADVVFDSPTAAADDFVTQALGVPATLGPFQAGDSRSGEVEVLFTGAGNNTQVTRGLLLLRQLGPDSTWFVLAAPNDVVTIVGPEQGSEVVPGPVTVHGVARGFEGAVTITAFLAGDRSSVLDQQHTIAGSMEEPGPYEVTLDLSQAEDGDMIAILVQGGVGLETDPGDFAAIAVVAGDSGSGVANPASAFCEDQGGTVEIVTADDGSQSGVCHLPDGTSVDEWEYYRENNPDGASG